MKLHLDIFLAAVLLRRISADCLDNCPPGFRGRPVCALQYSCYLDMEYCSMLAINCARHAEGKPMFMFLHEGQCSKGLEHQPCKSVDF
nr:uncharacterized protein LOC108081298 [Drosophila kikkawai]